MQPFDTETEWAVLATLMHYNDKFSLFADLLEVGLFYYEKEKAMFRCIEGVINSGGIKIHAEEVEQMLRPHLSMPFIITKATDPKFGEVVALVYEEGSFGESIQSICQSVLPKYWQPRRYLPVEQILLTETGKPRRDISLYSN